MDKYIVSIINGLMLGNASFDKENNLIIKIDCIEVKSFLLKSRRQQAIKCEIIRVKVVFLLYI